MIKHVEYLDGFQYTGGELNFFPHAEGYVNVVLGTTGNRIYNYVYNYTDHLGNIRLSYTKDLVNNQLKILEENNYYPFGLKHQKYGASSIKDLQAVDENIARPGYATRTDYQYKYNGQEWQDELGLNMYDMDMRQYDPAIARWVVMDPVIHHSMSPYNSFDNNPVFWADPSGADSVFESGGTEVASVTNMASGVSIGAGGASSSKSNSSEGSSKSGDKSPIGGVSGEFDHSLFDGDPDNHNPNATVLPEVVASNSAELNAGLESRAIMAIGMWNHHNFGASISSFDPNSRGFWGRLSNSDNFFKKLAYGVSNDMYLTLQTLDFDSEIFGEGHKNPLGGSAFTNLDGTAQYNVADRASAFGSTLTPFLAETKVAKPILATTRNAAQYNTLFKGTIITKMSSQNRGVIYRGINSDIRTMNYAAGWLADPFNIIDLYQASK